MSVNDGTKNELIMKEKTCIWSETGFRNGRKYSFSQYFVFDDGGRSKYFQGSMVGDCVTRSIAIATQKDYKEAYDALFNLIREFKQGRSLHAREIKRRKVGARGTTPRNGVPRELIKKYMESIGWSWFPTMEFSKGCKVHLRSDELPGGRLVVSVSKHLTAMIDGVIHDTFDCSRGGQRCVYGYFKKVSP